MLGAEEALEEVFEALLLLLEEASLGEEASVKSPFVSAFEGSSPREVLRG